MLIFDAFKLLIPPGSKVLDIGGHVGKIAGVFGVLAGPTGEVHTFEPHPILYFDLSALCSLAETENKLRILPYSKALSDSIGHCTFNISRFVDKPEFNQASSIEPALANESRLGDNFIRIMVETDTVDNFCRAHFVAPTFIKIDTEGADYRVIRGAHQAIERYRPAIILEFGFHPHQDIPTNKTEHLSYLESAGYDLFIVDIMHFNGKDSSSTAPFMTPHILPISVEELPSLPGMLAANILALPRRSERYDNSPIRGLISPERGLQYLRRC